MEEYTLHTINCNKHGKGYGKLVEKKSFTIKIKIKSITIVSWLHTKYEEKSINAHQFAGIYKCNWVVLYI